MLVLVEQQNLVENIVIHVVEINTVSEVFIKIIYLAIQLPVLVPVFGDGHAYKHNPSQSHGRVFAELAHGIRQIAFANLRPLFLDVWSIRKLLVNTLLGFALLGILSALGVLAKLSLGLNLFNALVIAVLGVPGLALLILLRLVFI